MFLQKGKSDAQHHHGEDHDGGAQVSGRPRHGGESEEQAVERVLQAAIEFLQHAGLRLLGDAVRPDARKPRRGLRTGQAIHGCAQFAEQRSGWLLCLHDDGVAFSQARSIQFALPFKAASGGTFPVNVQARFARPAMADHVPLNVGLRFSAKALRPST